MKNPSTYFTDFSGKDIFVKEFKIYNNGDVMNITMKAYSDNVLYVMYFENVSGIKLKDVNSSFQICGFSIEDNKEKGYQKDMRYTVDDYEDGVLFFYCEDFSVKPKVHGYSYNTFPLFFMKKHYCPICSSELEKVKNSKIVNSKSEEAKNFDFSSGDTYMIGSVKFVWNELYCPACNKNYTVKEIRALEKQSK